jgi:hypothetical protein
VVKLQLKIDEMLDGALRDLSEVELEKVIENILDLNTDSKKREIKIEIIITPTSDRDGAVLEMKVSSKLRPRNGIDTTIALGKVNDIFDAVETNNQLQGQLSVDGGTGEIKEVGKLGNNSKLTVIGMK